MSSSWSEDTELLFNTFHSVVWNALAKEHCQHFQFLKFFAYFLSLVRFQLDSLRRPNNARQSEFYVLHVAIVIS